MRYRDIGAAADRVMAGAAFFVGFNLVVAALCAVSLNAGNLLISIVTADAVLLAGAISRSAWCALHAKLDAILSALPDAPNTLMHAEDRDEAEIGTLRP